MKTLCDSGGSCHFKRRDEGVTEFRFRELIGLLGGERTYIRSK